MTRRLLFGAHSRHAPAEIQHPRPSSSELECVFLSTTPNSGNRSRMTLGFYLEFPGQLVDANFTHT